MTIKLTDQLVYLAIAQDNSFKATGSDAQTYSVATTEVLVFNAQVSDAI